LRISKVNLELSLDPSHCSPSAWKIPPLEVGPSRIKSKSWERSVVKDPGVPPPLLVSLRLVELGTLSLQLGLHCNSQCCLVILKTPIDVMPWLNLSFCSNVRKALFTLAVINQVLCSTIFVSIKDSIDSSVLNLVFSVLLKPCDLN
jgi:hypothetical protein